MALLVFFAFISGVVTIVSPCVLPVLPLLLSTSASGGRARPLGVVAGFVLSFVVATLALAAALQALGLPGDILRLVAIAALGLFGLTMLLPSWGRAIERVLLLLARAARPRTGQVRGGFRGGLALGAGLGLLWSPCVGPIMASVIALAVSRGASGGGAAITTAYALGAGLPMLAIAYGARKVSARAKALGPRAGAIRRGFGGLTVLTCLLLLFGLQSNVQRLMPTAWSNALTGFESAGSVQKELDKLEPQKPSLPADVADANTAATPAAQLAPPTSTPVPPTSTAAPSIATPLPAAGQKPGGGPSNPGLDLRDMGPAPELTGIEGWINSAPLSIKGLRGKVVIVDFWTFECYNCQNTLPYVKALYDKYHSQGLEIIGVHTPEFSFERVPENVKQAAKQQGVTWPIALDPDYKTWSAYNNRYWPAFYFIDSKGHIRYTHFGEGNYEYNESVVQQLLHESSTAER